MLRFHLDTDHEGAMRALYGALKDCRARLEYYSFTKGIVVFKKPYWSLWPMAQMVVDVQPASGGTLVILHSFYPPTVWQYRGAKARFEERIARLIKGHAI